MPREQCSELICALTLEHTSHHPTSLKVNSHHCTTTSKTEFRAFRKCFLGCDPWILTWVQAGGKSTRYPSCPIFPRIWLALKDKFRTINRPACQNKASQTFPLAFSDRKGAELVLPVSCCLAFWSLFVFRADLSRPPLCQPCCFADWVLKPSMLQTPCNLKRTSCAAHRNNRLANLWLPGHPAFQLLFLTYPLLKKPFISDAFQPFMVAPDSASSSLLFFPLLSSSFLFFPLLSSSFLFFPLLSSSFLFFPLLSSSFLFFPVLSSSFLFFPLLSSSFLFFPLLSSSFLFFPLLSSSFLFFPLLSSSCLFFPLLSSSFLFFPLLSSSFLLFSLFSSSFLFFAIAHHVHLPFLCFFVFFADFTFFLVKNNLSNSKLSLLVKNYTGSRAVQLLILLILVGLRDSLCSILFWSALWLVAGRTCQRLENSRPK